VVLWRMCPERRLADYRMSDRVSHEARPPEWACVQTPPFAPVAGRALNGKAEPDPSGKTEVSIVKVEGFVNRPLA
jgi:hypothetical protein